jgi:ribonuclease Z
MRPSFHPRLVNGPFDDPALFIPFLLQKRALLFDLGDLHALAPREILKISHVFVYHTHMDHFVGFDHLLRLFLGREKRLCLFGPPGFLTNVEGKLSGYTWNLVTQYTNRFVLEVSEFHPQALLTCQYRVQDGFRPGRGPQRSPFDGRLRVEPGLTITVAALDHRIPSMAFALQERFHVNIRRDRLAALGVTPGDWLQGFKQALFCRQDPASVFEVPARFAGGRPRQFALAALAAEIAVISPGQKIAYIADAVFSPENIEKMLALAHEADHLFIEAAFLDQDRRAARQKFHLTARQAGEIAGRARARQVTVFHFSPRYSSGELLTREARTAWRTWQAGGSPEPSASAGI